MVTEELKREIIYSEDQQRLFEIMVDLTEEVSSVHLSMAKCDDQVLKTELKGQVAVINALLSIINQRVDSLKANESSNERRELLSNRQFRMAAEVVLQKETFSRIKELSEMNYKKFKDLRNSLKENKIE